MSFRALPWLFIGPAIGASLGHLAWIATRAPLAKWIALACAAWVLSFALIAWLASRRKR